MKPVFFLVMAAVAFSPPAMASQRCNQPYAPVIKVSASASLQDLATLRGDVASFIAASDVYQKCLIEKGDTPAIHANQLAKEKVGGEFNALVKAFKADRKG